MLNNSGLSPLFSFALSSKVRTVLLTTALVCTSFTANALTIIPKKTQCLAPLYVSGNHLVKTTNAVQSLKLFVNDYHPKIPLDVLQNLMVSTHLFDSSDVKKAIKGANSHNAASQTQPDASQLKSTISLLRKINREYKDIKQLIGAVENNKVDALMEYHLPDKGQHSLINFALQKKPTTADVQKLIDLGARVYPSTIFDAIDYDNPDILDVLLQYFDDTNSQHNNYTSYAVTYGSYDIIKTVVNARIGQTTGTLEKLLNRYALQLKQSSLEPSNDSQSQAFRSKLRLLLDSGFTTAPQIAQQALIDFKGHLDDLTPKLAHIAQSPQELNPSIHPKVKADAIEYLTELKTAKKQWPSFIFAYDKHCIKAPAKSHYHVDNLLTPAELKKLLSDNRDQPIEFVSQVFKTHGDIYQDWYQLHITKPLGEPAKTKQNHKDIVRLFKLMLDENWPDIEDFRQQQKADKTSNYVIDRQLINIGITANVPDFMIEQWHDSGAVLDHDSFQKLLANPQYNQWVIDKLKQNKLPIVSHKSVLYHAAASGNFALLKKLLITKGIAPEHKTDSGVSALTWTLLNFSTANNPDIKQQLDLLLKHTKTLTAMQKQLLAYKKRFGR